jgi:hypothetical protein
MGPSLALDFLAMIDARERLPGGAFAILDEADRAILQELLRGYHEQGLPQGTGLQNLRQEYGPWRQLTRPTAGNPAVLLLQDGGYYASQRWTVPAGAPGWQRPAASDVASARVDGDQASITDADGGAWAPGTVLRIDRDGAVWSLSLTQATAARRSLGR